MSRGGTSNSPLQCPCGRVLPCANCTGGVQCAAASTTHAAVEAAAGCWGPLGSWGALHPSRLCLSSVSHHFASERNFSLVHLSRVWPVGEPWSPLPPSLSPIASHLCELARGVRSLGRGRSLYQQRLQVRERHITMSWCRRRAWLLTQCLVGCAARS